MQSTGMSEWFLVSFYPAVFTLHLVNVDPRIPDCVWKRTKSSELSQTVGIAKIATVVAGPYHHDWYSAVWFVRILLYNSGSSSSKDKQISVASSQLPNWKKMMSAKCLRKFTLQYLLKSLRKKPNHCPKSPTTSTWTAALCKGMSGCKEYIFISER